jgi:multiple sugar transport system substrate-binding protein
MATDMAHQNATFKATGRLPAYTPAWRDPQYDNPVDFFGGQRVYRLWADIATKTPAGTVSQYDQQVDQIVGVELDNALSKGKDPEQAMHDAETTALKQIPGLSV